MAVFVVEFLGFFVQTVAWGLKKVPRKFEELFKKIDIFFTKNGKIIVYHIFAVAATGGNTAAAEVG